MSDLFWLSAAQMRSDRAVLSAAPSHTRVDDRRVISRIIFVIRDGPRLRDVSKAYGPHKTIYNKSFTSDAKDRTG